MDIFHQVLEANENNRIPFNPDWRASSRRYRPTKADRIEIGDIKISTDPEQQRHIVFVGTRFGIVTVYQLNSKGFGNVYMSTWSVYFPVGLRNAMGAISSLSLSEVEVILGSPDGAVENVGLMLEEIFKHDEIRTRGEFGNLDTTLVQTKKNKTRLDLAIDEQQRKKMAGLC